MQLIVTRRIGNLSVSTAMISPQQSRKRVRFAKMSTMIIVEDCARGEAIKQRLWYSGEDVDQFKVEATQTSHILRRFFSCSEESRDDDQVSTRAEYIYGTESEVETKVCHCQEKGGCERCLEIERQHRGKS
jgi:hypothetical protein